MKTEKVFKQKDKDKVIKFVCLFVWWCLTPLSTIFQLYRGTQFYWGGNLQPVASH